MAVVSRIWIVRMLYTLRMKAIRMSRVASLTEPPNCGLC
jgi:hypothetical protein